MVRQIPLKNLETIRQLKMTILKSKSTKIGN